MSRNRLPAFRVRARIQSEPLWTRLADAPLSVQMALEEVGGKDAAAEAVCAWLSERLHVHVDLASLGIDADEAIHGAVRLGITEVSIDRTSSGEVPVCNATAAATIRVKDGLDERRAAESTLTHIGSGAVRLCWCELSQSGASGWHASHARVEFERCAEADSVGHVDDLTPEQWFSETGSAGVRRGRRVRLTISVSRANLEAAFDQHQMPRELRDGCPWQHGATEDLDLEHARKWLSKHLCFELAMVSSASPFMQVEAALEKLRGAKVASVSRLDLVGGWPVIDIQTTIAVQVEGNLDGETLAVLEQSIVLSWRDGSGCVGEQERYELAGPRHPISVTIS